MGFSLGTPPLVRAVLHITMKLWVSLLLVMVVMVSLSQATKGGAKSVINRNRRQRNRGGHGIGSNHGDDTMEGGAGTVTGMGDFSKGPCVGVCYYIKKRGIKLDEKMKQRMKRRKPCIGLCHIKKMRQRRKQILAKKENKEDI